MRSCACDSVADEWQHCLREEGFCVGCACRFWAQGWGWMRRRVLGRGGRVRACLLGESGLLAISLKRSLNSRSLQIQLYILACSAVGRASLSALVGFDLDWFGWISAEIKGCRQLNSSPFWTAPVARPGLGHQCAAYMVQGVSGALAAVAFLRFVPSDQYCCSLWA